MVVTAVTLMWQSVPWPGTEHLVIRTTPAGVVAEGRVVSVDSRPIELRYLIECDLDWAVRSLDVDEIASGTSFAFRSDGAGRWRDGAGNDLPELEGCVDVDIAATPFTNSLPIRRLPWQVGQSRDLRMVWLLVPELTVRPADQRYTCLEKRRDGATFRYASGDFHVDLPVDADGYVLDYPGFWRRIWPEPSRLGD